MIIATASNAYVLFFRTPPTRAAFLKRARVKPGTYAEELMGDIYDDVFRHCCELRREYQRYYAVEYSHFSAFLACFGHLPKEICDRADSHSFHYTHIIPYHPPGFLQDEDGLNLLARLFNLKIKSR